ncbi:hypothetical protein H4K36_17000 [Streptomyces sp. DHE7-1]|nr:hypothetical protein [Streptomyces sp. DHE7-1]
MGRDETPGRPGGNGYWTAADLGAAAAMGGAQLPAAGLLWWIVASTVQDDYGAGSVGALGVVCVLIFAPVLLPLLGMALTFVLTLPAVVLARLAGRHLGGPAWLRHLLTPLAPAVLWGGVTVPLWSLTTSVPVLTALGVLPTLWVGCARRRAWRQWGVWWRAAAASAVLFLAALGGGFVATETGVVKPYEPPELTTARLAGVWHGDGGAELRLSPDGRATAVRLPAEPRTTTGSTTSTSSARAPAPGSRTTGTTWAATASCCGSTVTAARTPTGPSAAPGRTPSCTSCSATRTRGGCAS